MENDGEQPLIIVEETSDNGHVHLVSESKDGNQTEKDKEKSQKHETLIESSDSNLSSGPVINEKERSGIMETSDLQQNSKEAFTQFNIQPKLADSQVKERRPSAEEIAQNWKNLGVHRCPNCKFMTDNEELYRNHYTTCPSVKSMGPIQLTYKDEVFCCLVCKDSWRNKAEFEEHVVCHLQDSPYICLTCTYRKFSSRQDIEIHTKKEHPSGDARCGLKGMKNARKYTDELLIKGSCTIHGKLSIPKTPRNHINVSVVPKESTASKTTDGDVKSGSRVTTGSDNSVVYSTVVTSSQTSQSSTDIPKSSVYIVAGSTDVAGSTASDMSSTNASTKTTTDECTNLPKATISATVQSSANASTSAVMAPPVPLNISEKVGTVEVDPPENRPMPPARSSVGLISMVTAPVYASNGEVLKGISVLSEAKGQQQHIDSLFGKMNWNTNQVQPANISQKIKNIANPAQVAVSTEQVPYHLKSFTEYTQSSTAPIMSASQAVSGKNIYFVPLGKPLLPAVNASQLPQTRFIYQTPQNRVLLPVQSVNQSGPRANLGQLVGDDRRQPAPNVVVTQIQINKGIPSVGLSQNNNTFGNSVNINGPQEYVLGSYAGIQPKSTVQTVPTQHVAQAGSYSVKVATVNNHPPPRAVSTAGESVGDTAPEAENPKKYLFKIKPGQGFVCEVCKKFTKDEYVFRKHLWEHFHGVPRACKTCSLEFITQKSVLECMLVNNIVCNLIKRSTVEQTEIPIPERVLKASSKDVIDITEDEISKGNSSQQDKRDNSTEVIVVDDDDDENGDGQGLGIQISATYSLSDSKGLKQMTTGQDTSSYTDVTGSQQIDKVVHVEIEKVETKEIQNGSSNWGENEVNERNVSRVNIDDQSNADVNSKPTDLKSNIENKSDSVGSKSPSGINMDVALTSDGSEDGDGKMRENLLDKSLSEPERDSEEVVSQVLETNLRVYDPLSKPSDIKSAEDTVMRSHERDLNYSNVDTTLFDNEVLSKESHNAFYKCGYENCSFTCLSSGKYREHLQSVQHRKEYYYVCGHCGSKDYTEDTHVRHIFTHANSRSFILYKCPNRMCKYKTNLLRLYAEHLRAHPSDELIMKCVHCHRTFPSIESLIVHLKKNLLKFVVCPHCSFRFMNRYVVLAHMKYSHPDKLRLVSVTSQIVCYEREINFYVFPKSSGHVTAEMVTPEGRDTDLLDIPALLDDFQRSAEEENSEQASKDDKQADISDDVDCLSLPEDEQSDFLQESHFKGQSETKSNAESPKRNKTKSKMDSNTSTGPKSLECAKCGYLSYNVSLHVKHLSLHETEPEREKRFLCDLCPKGTEILTNFKKHVGNHIGRHVIKVLCCTSCTYSTNQKCHIMDHVRDAHSEKTVYTLKEEVVESSHAECKYCSFKARTSEQILSHEIVVHRVEPSVAVSTSPQNKVDNTEENKMNKAATEQNKSESSTPKKKYKYHCEYCSDFFKHKSKLKDHILNDHKDIEHKQFVFFKCKYCMYTSTMKEMIIAHLKEDHPGMELRILRKIEMVENIDAVDEDSNMVEREPPVLMKETNLVEEKEEVEIPDGNIFRQVFSCPKCTFISNVRIKTMKHLKQHPELKPVRQDSKKPDSKRTARKSSSSNTSKGGTPRYQSSLLQPDVELSKSLTNPFVSLKENSDLKDAPIESSLPESDSPETWYVLGEQTLHSALSSCFIPLEKGIKYQCRICKQKIFKKFVLHRHILNHLNIVFFKCKYCSEGSIERTLMIGHIQKVHPSKPVSYDSVDKPALEQQFKEVIFKQNFNDTVDLNAESMPEMTTDDHLKKSGIVKKPVHEFQLIEDDDDSENLDDDDHGKEEPIKEDTEDSSKVNSLKCPHCRYIARYKHNLNLHLDSHADPAKKFTCSVCDYRGEKFSVIKHVYQVFHLTPAKVLVNGHSLYENVSSPKDQPKREEKESAVEEPELTEAIQDSTTTAGKQDKLDSIIVSKTGVYEFRSVYKCRECGEKFSSRNGIFRHFKMFSNCRRPLKKCSICSFKNAVKTAVHSHAVKRHRGKKVTVVTLPLTSNFRIFRYPVRQSDSIRNDFNDKNLESSSEMGKSKGHGTEKELGSLDEGQIRCQLCSKYACESIMKMQFHVNTVHQGIVLCCQKCSYKSPLVKHMVNHCKHVHLQNEALYGSKPANSKKEIVRKQVNETKILANTNRKIVFKCPKCNLELKKLVIVQTHLYVHFNYKPYSCKYCVKHFTRPEHVKRHISNQHPGKPEKYNTNINEAVETKVKKLYESVKKNVMKQKIMLGITRPSYLDKMEIVEDGIRRKGKIFYCNFCRSKSDRKATIRLHVEKKHAGISKKRPLEIDSDSEERNSTVSKAESSQDLSANSTPVKSMKKDESVKGNSDPVLKYKVVKTANGTKNFKCTECDYMNEKISCLKNHIWRNHSSPTQTEGVICCCYCPYYSIHTSSDVIKHTKSHHPLEELKYINKSGHVIYREGSASKEEEKYSPTPSKSPRSSSPASESTISDRSPIKPKNKKQRTFVTNYNCSLCAYSAEGLFHFRLHLIGHREFTKTTSVLDEESKKSCGFCSYLSKNNFDLCSHIASHMANMRYRCGYCDYNSFDKRCVISHQKNCHDDREICIFDRELKRMSTGAVKLVDFNPRVELGTQTRKTMKKRYRRIVIESDDSSNDSDLEDRSKGVINESRKKGSACRLEATEESSQKAENTEQVDTDMETTVAESSGVDVCNEDKGEDEDLPWLSEEEQSTMSKQSKQLSKSAAGVMSRSQLFSMESEPFSPSDLHVDEDEHTQVSSQIYSECQDSIHCSMETKTISDPAQQEAAAEDTGTVNCTPNQMGDCKNQDRTNANMTDTDIVCSSSQEVGYKDDDINKPALTVSIESKETSDIAENSLGLLEQSGDARQVEVESDVKISGIGVSSIDSERLNITESVDIQDSTTKETSKNLNEKTDGSAITSEERSTMTKVNSSKPGTENEDISDKSNGKESLVLETQDDNIMNDASEISEDSVEKVAAVDCLVSNDVNNSKDDVTVSGIQCSTIDSENVCSSSNSVLIDKKEIHSEQSKSPRNVFDSMVEAEDLEQKKYELQKTFSDVFATDNDTNSEKLCEQMDANVFDKFTSESEIDPPLECSENIVNEKYYGDGKDNIFEKLTPGVGGPSANELEQTSESEEIVEKNIFETFGGIHCDENTEGEEQEKLETEAENDNDDNIFSKFSVENVATDDSLNKEENVNLPDGCSKDSVDATKDDSAIESSSKTRDNAKPREEFKSDSDLDNGKNLSEKHELAVSSVSNVEEERRVEDMEVDELIQSIEDTVNASAI